MKKIVVVSGHWPSVANPISGIFVVQQIAALCRADCDITVVVGKTVGKRNEQPLTPSELGLPSSRVFLHTVPVLRFPEAFSVYSVAFEFNIRSIGFFLSKKIEEMQREKGKYDACIIHGLRYFAISIEHWIRYSNIPNVAFIHGVDPFIVRNRELVKNYVYQSIRHIDHVALVGSPLYSFASDLGIASSKLVVVHNGTDLPPLADTRPTVGSPTGQLRIVSVSNLIALKGIDDNIRALHLMKIREGRSDWIYRIVGDGPERQRLSVLVDDLGLAAHVEFLGRLSYSQTMLEIGEADIFSLPSWGDAFGIVYLEAMARMKPTIGCSGSGAGDIISNNFDGILVPMKDPDALYFAFQRLFDSPQLREELGREARRTAERFTWDANASRVLELFGFGH